MAAAESLRPEHGKVVHRVVRCDRRALARIRGVGDAGGAIADDMVVGRDVSLGVD
jgi:hypothetical protein